MKKLSGGPEGDFLSPKGMCVHVNHLNIHTHTLLLTKKQILGPHSLSFSPRIVLCARVRWTQISEPFSICPPTPELQAGFQMLPTNPQV